MTTSENIVRATLTVKETSELLGISENQTYEYLIQGKLPAQRLGKKWIISRDRIMKWLDESPAVPLPQRRR